MNAPLLQVNDLKKHFPVRGHLLKRNASRVYAVDGVSFEIAPMAIKLSPRRPPHMERRSSALAISISVTSLARTSKSPNLKRVLLIKAPCDCFELPVLGCRTHCSQESNFAMNLSNSK